MKKIIYIKPEVDVVAALTQEHILVESKVSIPGEGTNDIIGAGDGYDNGDDFEIDSKGNNNLWDGWDE